MSTKGSERILMFLRQLEDFSQTLFLFYKDDIIVLTVPTVNLPIPPLLGTTEHVDCYSICSIGDSRCARVLGRVSLVSSTFTHIPGTRILAICIA